MEFKDFVEIAKQMNNQYKKFLTKSNIINNLYGVAGAGKTTKMLQEYNSDELTPGEKLVVAFNKKVRKEIIDRLKLSKDDIKTFDSLFKSSNLISARDYNKVLRRHGLSQIHDPFSSIDERYGEYILALKTVNVSRILFHREVIKDLLRVYNQKKVIPFEFFPYFYFYKEKTINKELIYIDEIQDVNPSYFANLPLDSKYFFAGAGDQTIYQVFGASVENYVLLFKRSKKRTLLTKSYRVPQVIARYVNRMRLSMASFETLSPVKGFIKRTTLSGMLDYLLFHYNRGDEIGIHTRTRKEKRLVLNLLRKRGYFILPDDKEIVEMYSIISSQGKNIKKNVFEKFFNYDSNYFWEDEKGYIHFRALRTLTDFDKKEEDLFFDVLSKNILAEAKELFKEVIRLYKEVNVKKMRTISLKDFNTVHAVKGTEVDYSFYLTGTSYIRRLVTLGKIKRRDEENVSYVAFTRAKKGMYIIGDLGWE